jgi:hypothetical protein
VKFKFEIEIDGKELSAALDSAGKGALSAVLANPNTVELLGSVVQAVGIAMPVMGPRSSSVTPARSAPWASPEARAAAEAAGPPAVAQPWTAAVDPNGGSPAPPSPPVAAQADGIEKLVLGMLQAPLT